MKCYVTMISSKEYIPGVLALKRSLDNVRSKYPLKIFLHKDLVNTIMCGTEFKESDFIIYENSVLLNENIIKLNAQSSNSQWNKTFDKILLFGRIEFRKIVFLDSDMMIVKNIDELFERTHMTSCCPTQGNMDYRRGFNSGLMVIEPQVGLDKSILEVINSTQLEEKKYQSISDNDLLNMFYLDWISNTSLQLSDEYNLLFPFMNEYLSKGFREGDAKVIHFIGAMKPWMYTTLETEDVIKSLNSTSVYSCMLFREYIELCRS